MCVQSHGNGSLAGTVHKEERAPARKLPSEPRSAAAHRRCVWVQPLPTHVGVYAWTHPQCVSTPHTLTPCDGSVTCFCHSAPDPVSSHPLSARGSIALVFVFATRLLMVSCATIHPTSSLRDMQAGPYMVTSSAATTLRAHIFISVHQLESIFLRKVLRSRTAVSKGMRASHLDQCGWSSFCS